MTIRAALVADSKTSLLALGGALEVGDGVDPLCHRPPLLRRHRFLLHFTQLLDRVGVITEVLEVNGSCLIAVSAPTFLFPTRTMGTLGQEWLTSGAHFSRMFSNESEKARLCSGNAS